LTQPNAYIRTGTTRTGFSLMFHELFDLYHPYIGDKATLYYLYLLRYRNNNKEGDRDHGRSWNGRVGVVEKFQLSYSTLPILDDILEASGLVEIERRPIGRGKDKIYYIVNDPLTRAQFREKEAQINEALRNIIDKHGGAIGRLLGKEKGAKLLA
jgi:replication initiation and membrane attachment protein DnaB